MHVCVVCAHGATFPMHFLFTCSSWGQNFCAFYLCLHTCGNSSDALFVGAELLGANLPWIFDACATQDAAASMHFVPSLRTQGKSCDAFFAVVEHRPGNSFDTFLQMRSLRGNSLDAFSAGAEPLGEQLRCFFLRVRSLWGNSFDTFLAVVEPLEEQL